jgi:hypothetical protein
MPRRPLTPAETIAAAQAVIDMLERQQAARRAAGGKY